MAEYGLLGPGQQGFGLLNYDPKRARMDAFIQGLGAMGSGLIAAGAPSTDPGSFGKNLAAANQSFTNTFRNSMEDSRMRAFQDFQVQQQQQDMLAKRKQEQAREQLANTVKMGGKDMAGQPVNVQGLLAQAYPDQYGKAMVSQAFPTPQKPIPVSPGSTLYDPGTQKALYTAPVKPTPMRPLTREAKAKQDYDNGLITKASYDAILASTGRPGVEVNLPGKGVPMMEALGQTTAGQIQDWRKAGVDAAGFSSQISDLKSLLDSGVQTGFGQEFKNNAAKLARTVGLDVDIANLGGAEAFQSISNQLVVPRVKQLGAKPTDKDLEFIVDQFPTLSNTPEGNKLILDVLELSAKRDQARSEFATDWVRKNAQTDPYGLNFESDYREWAANNPLFKPYQPPSFTESSGAKSPTQVRGPGGSVSPGAYGDMDNEAFMRANPFDPARFNGGGK